MKLSRSIRLTLLSLSLFGAIACASLRGGLQSGDPVPYPEGYRQWTHVKSLVLQPGHPLYESFGGIHHIYANGPALSGLQEGKGNYADGSVLVFDLLEAQTAGGALSEGARKVVGVMHKDEDAFASTGGWGFAGFGGDTKDNVITEPASACFQCHTSQADQGYVFSTWRP